MIAFWLDDLRQDLSYAARGLWRAPGFTLGAMAILGLGIGVNLSEYQIFDQLLFHRITVREADSILALSRSSKQGKRLGFPPAAVDFYRTQSRSLDWLVSEDNTTEMVVDGEPAVRSTFVSGNYFGSLGVTPAWGRLLDERDSKPGAAAVVVLGYDYWTTRCGGDPHIIGRTVRIGTRPVQVPGVLPYTFDGLRPRGTAMWLPEQAKTLLSSGGVPGSRDFAHATDAVFVRLKPGVTLAAAEGELTSLTRELRHQQPLYFPLEEQILGEPVQMPASRALLSGRDAPIFIVFFSMVALVLFSACANLGNMLLARGIARQREMEIRLAIGAGRGRIVRQLMTENFLLAVLGTGAGIAFGVLASRLLLLEMDAPPQFRMRLALRVSLMAAGFVLTLISMVAFGLPAALHTSRPKHRIARLRQGLVGLQVAVSCLLLIASAVLAHTGIKDAAIDIALDYRNMVVVYPKLYAENLPAAQARGKVDALLTRLSGLPGVESVAVSVDPPFSGRSLLDTQPRLHVVRSAVEPSYFRAMGLPLVRGRTFRPEERNGVIVSESAARALWPNEDPLGKVWKYAGADRTVTGVVRDSGVNLLGDPESVEAYVPIADAEVDRSALVIHTDSDPAPLVRLIPAAAAALDETVEVSLMRSAHDNFIDGSRKVVTLIGSIGAVATALAAAGMFALVAFTVAQRRRELGIRLAIGARCRHILSVLLSQNSRPTLLGIVAGTILAGVVSRLVRSFTILGDGIDLIGFAAGIAGFLLVAVFATLSPALRALRIDPSAILREE